ncbi:Potassium channel subfamily K member 9-like 2 [Homarus americanus]|uniref:Potassium channel subfamily K member 9-like 2 n=1 Tax=Homarus americanus TaxID=6706 RepID=A0A8J5MM75_HOMAM|nr:Potassium channel subfamily K member 9-like 2 [Homarus americanus]
MRQQNVRTLSLVVCTFTYLLIGAAVFDALESDTETERLRIIETVRQELLGRYNISGSEYKLIETVIIENQPHKAGPQWKFAGALVWALDSRDRGREGFLYRVRRRGHPLGYGHFTSVIIKKMKKMLGCTTTEATDVNQLCVTGTLSSIVMTAGAAVFSHYENWNYIDAFYYCFITLTTIGFGDFVALQSVVTLDGELMAINGKLLAGTHESELGEGRVGSYTSIATVCSCTCYPRPHHSPTDSRHRYSIVRSPSRISNLLVEQGGGSKIDPHQSDQFPPLLHDSFMVANYLKTKRSSV